MPTQMANDLMKKDTERRMKSPYTHKEYPKTMYHKDHWDKAQAKALKTKEVADMAEHWEARQDGWVETPAIFVAPESSAAEQAKRKYGFMFHDYKQQDETEEEADELAASVKPKRKARGRAAQARN